MIGSKLELAVVSSGSLEDQRYGLRLLEAVCDASPALCPLRVANYEPIRNIVSPGDFEAALRYWEYPFLWQSRDSRGSCFRGSARMGRAGTVMIRFRGDSGGEVAAPDCLSRLPIGLEADYGLLFVSTPEEISWGAKAGFVLNLDRAGKHWTFSIFDHKIERVLPDAYWATAFGPRFVRQIGLERLLSAPAHSVQRLTEELVLIQLTDQLSDVVLERGKFVAARERVKKHLGSELFFRAA